MGSRSIVDYAFLKLLDNFIMYLSPIICLRFLCDSCLQGRFEGKKMKTLETNWLRAIGKGNTIRINVIRFVSSYTINTNDNRRPFPYTSRKMCYRFCLTTYTDKFDFDRIHFIVLVDEVRKIICRVNLSHFKCPLIKRFTCKQWFHIVLIYKVTRDVFPLVWSDLDFGNYVVLKNNELCFNFKNRVLFK